MSVLDNTRLMVEVCKLCYEDGLSQKEIAKRVGVHPSTVSKYVRMEKYPSIDTFAELCRAIGASSDRILGLDNSLE